jgi:hypothetical protein
MHIEAFTHPKDPARPDSNEDRLVIYGDTLFAVIDGVTDKSGALYGGLTGGQLAGRIIEGALRDLVDSGRHLSADSREILELIDSRFQESYERLVLLDVITADPNYRFGAQLCAVFRSGDRLRLLHVGDCGVRIDGVPLPGRNQPGDEIMARQRAVIFAELAAAGADTEECLLLARKFTVEGLQAFPDTAEGPLDATAWAALRTRLLQELPDRFPHLPADLVREAATGGLKHLAAFRNSDHPLGHGCIDGSSVPDAFILDREIPLSETGVIELFSDGYFGAPESFGSVHAWEQHLARIEREDPAKTGTVPSTKGSAPGRFTDDRTILILRKEAPQHAPA